MSGCLLLIRGPCLARESKYIREPFTGPLLCTYWVLNHYFVCCFTDSVYEWLHKEVYHWFTILEPNITLWMIYRNILQPWASDGNIICTLWPLTLNGRLNGKYNIIMESGMCDTVNYAPMNEYFCQISLPHDWRVHPVITESGISSRTSSKATLLKTRRSL